PASRLPSPPVCICGATTTAIYSKSSATASLSNCGCQPRPGWLTIQSRGSPVYPKDDAMLIWKNLKDRAVLHPEKPALVCNGATPTYARFLAQSERLAVAWLGGGLQPGDRIALHLRNGLEFATGYYACLAAGFIAVPINNRLRPEEIAWVLEHSES